MEYISLIALWGAWCIVHSGMISQTVIRFLKDVLGDFYRFYRLLYNLVALTTFIPLVLYELTLKGRVLFRWYGNLIIIQILLMITVIFLIFIGGKKYDISQFLGTRQIKTGKANIVLSETGKIDTSGILGVTRHPWYLAAIIFIWINFREMYVSTLIVRVILTVYIIIGVVLEERKLVAECGHQYLDYQKQVSMLFPFKWLIYKISRERSASDG